MNNTIKKYFIALNAKIFMSRKKIGMWENLKESLPVFFAVETDAKLSHFWAMFPFYTS